MTGNVHAVRQHSRMRLDRQALIAAAILAVMVIRGARGDVLSGTARGASGARTSCPAAGTSREEVFVVGCGHSGTTIMLRLIGNHRGIHYTPDETCALCRVGRGIAPDEDETNEWKRSAQRLAKIDDMAVAAGTRRWVEKTPIHVRYLDKLFLLRPRAHVVMMVRDGRDVAASFKGRAKPERALEMVTHGAKRWVDDTEAGLLYASHKQVLVVRYEDFATHPEIEMARVFDFLCEDFNATEIFAPKETVFNGVSSKSVTSVPTDEAGANHEQLRAYQVSHGLFDGRGRWKEPLPRGLSAAEREVVHTIGGQLLAKLGYAETSEWVDEPIANAVK